MYKIVTLSTMLSCLFCANIAFADEGIKSEQYYYKHKQAAELKIKDCENNEQTTNGNINCKNAQKSLDRLNQEETAKKIANGLSTTPL